MAGIGFELKKLYAAKGLVAKLKAHLYSTFVTVGPIVLSIIVITFLQTAIIQMQTHGQLQEQLL